MDNSTLEEALSQITAANQLFYKVVTQRSIIVIPDNVQKRAQYEEFVIKNYYISNADAATPLSTLALVAGTRCRVEEFFEDCKSYLGMAQYETRSWVGWHHHMTLVGLAHLFVTLARRRLKKSPGADAGPDGAAAGGGVGGAAVAVGSGH